MIKDLSSLSKFKYPGGIFTHSDKGLRPLVGGRPHTLILGSAPSLLSMSKGMYYGNPNNHFWNIMGNIIGFKVDKTFPDNELEYQRICKQVTEAGFIIWDVCNEFSRQGSSDSSLKCLHPNDINSLLLQYPSIHTIACNGSTCYKLLSTITKYRGKSRLYRGKSRTSQ